MTRRTVHSRPGEIPHNRGGPGLIGAWKESTPLVLSLRLNTLSPQVA